MVHDTGFVALSAVAHDRGIRSTLATVRLSTMMASPEAIEMKNL